MVLGKERDDLAPPDDPTLHHAVGLAAVVDEAREAAHARRVDVLVGVELEHVRVPFASVHGLAAHHLLGVDHLSGDVSS